MELYSTDENHLLKAENDDVSISPLSGAEALFLGAALETSDISPSKLLEQLQQNGKNHRSHQQNHTGFRGRIKKSGSFHTADQTRGSNISVDDDFMSCAENASDMDSIASNEYSLYSPLAVRTRISTETIDDITNNNNMARKVKTTMAKKEGTVPKKGPMEEAAAPITIPPPIVTGEDQMKVDAAEVVYGKAKDILAWGKSVPVVSFFVGTSEAVAGKALGVVGTDLSQLDGKIGSELTKFDSGILNPAIAAIANILMAVAGKSEETIKPIIDALLKPLGMLIKSEAKEVSPKAHTETTAPEVTVAN
jgi:hypothetical protein